MEKWIFENWLSPGDVVMLTAAVRDLHRAYPGRFLTDVRTACPGLWEHNPHLTPLKPKGRGVRSLLCHYPLIHTSNTAPYHFIHGFIEYLNAQLGLQIRPTEFRGDIHLSPQEQQRPGPVEEMLGAGPGSRDATAADQRCSAGGQAGCTPPACLSSRTRRARWSCTNRVNRTSRSASGSDSSQHRRNLGSGPGNVARHHGRGMPRHDMTMQVGNRSSGCTTTG